MPESVRFRSQVLWWSASRLYTIPNNRAGCNFCPGTNRSNEALQSQTIPPQSQRSSKSSCLHQLEVQGEGEVTVPSTVTECQLNVVNYYPLLVQMRSLVWKLSMGQRSVSSEPEFVQTVDKKIPPLQLGAAAVETGHNNSRMEQNSDDQVLVTLWSSIQRW